MFAAYASVVVLCAASLVVGQAILSLCGRRLTWLAGPVGLAALIVASGIAIKLPGHATAAAITLAALSLISIATLALGRAAPGGDPANLRSRIARTVRGTDAGRSPGVHPALAITAAALALLLASIPFMANGRVGILGVGLVNDDMANHLLIADWLDTRVGQMPVLIHQGYPVGPQALVAGLTHGLGIGVIDAFAGLTLAIPVITALVVVEALDGMRPGPRTVAGALVALPYLTAAYLAQEAFKEPTEALFVLSFALLLPRAVSVRQAIPLGVIAAGSVYTYSFPGLFWLIGTAGLYGAIALIRGAPGGDPANFRSRIARTVRGTDAERSPGVHPAALRAVAVAAGLFLLLVAPELGRMIDFTHFRAFKSATISGGLGNLRHQVSPLEALGIWPASDFRLSASDASGPAAAFYLGALVAAAAVAVALPRWIRRHGSAVPAALAAAIVIYLGARLFGTVYTSAKALAIAAPLISLISFGGLLEREPGDAGPGPAKLPRMSATSPRRDIPGASRDAARRLRALAGGQRRPLLRRLLALALAAGIALSSFLVLRQAPVAPLDHAEQLADLRPLTRGHDVLFLGRDNFVAYELRGARPFTAVRNYYDPNYVKPDLRLENVFQKFDFDSVTAETLDRFPFVITTRAAYASGPPPAFRPLRETRDFVLWKRTGPAGRRQTLAEGSSPGAVLDCRSRAGRRLTRIGGTATAFAATPVVGGRWSPSPTLDSDSPASQILALPAGRWEVSVQYDATRPLHVTAPGLDATLPANLGYRGSVPYYPAGEVTVRRGGTVRFKVGVERPPLAGRLLGTKSEADLGAIAASPGGRSPPIADGRGSPIPGEAELRIPLGHACGRYLDWYRPPGGH